MQKTMKQVLCKVLAFTMVVSAISVPSVSTVSAADTSGMIWETKYHQDFDKLTALAEDYTDYAVEYQSHAELENDTTGGKYLNLKTSTVVADPFGLKLAFPGSENADVVKLEYKVKLVDSADSWWPISEKITCTGDARAWSLRLSTDARYQIQAATDKTDIEPVQNTSGWFTVIHEYNNSTKTITTSFENPDGVSRSGSKTFPSGTGGISFYWFGAQSAGVVAYDNIKVSYGYNKPNDFELNFNDDTPGALFQHDKIEMANVEAKIANDATVGQCLSLKYDGSSPYSPSPPVAAELKNSLKVNAFDNAERADLVTISYKAKLGADTIPSASTDAWDGKSALRTKVLGTSNAWALQIRENLYQITGAVRIIEPSEYISGWFTVTHVLNQKTDQLTTTVKTADSRELTDTISYSGSITSYELINPDRSIVGEILVDDITVTYSFDDEGNAPVATVAVYAGEDVQSNLDEVSAFADKVIISFNVEMDKSTVTQNSVYIEDSEGNKIGCGVAFDILNKVYTMTLPTLLSTGTYNVVITADAKSTAELAATPTNVAFTVVSGAGLPTEKYSEDYVLDFNELSALPADESIIKFNSEAIPTLVGDGDDKYLSIDPIATTSNSDGMGANGKWSVLYKNIDTETAADKVTLSYDVRLSDISAGGAATYAAGQAGHESLHMAQ